MKAKAKTKSELIGEIAELRAKLEEMDRASHRRKGDKPNRDADAMYDMSRFPEENPNPVMRISASGELLYANRPAIEMLEAMGWQEGGSLPEVLARSIRGVLEKKSDQPYELRCPRNRVFSFAVSATAGGGDINVYALDITERKQAEEAMRQARQDLDRAQEVGQIGSWRMDVRRNVLTWSEENHRIFGVPKGTPLTYETFLGIVHPGDRQYVDKKWQAALSGEPYDIEHRIIADQQVKWVREKAYLEFDDEGQLLGGFGITQDITERKLAEEALRQSEERYRSLFEGMTEGFALHEIICDEKGVPCDYRFLEVNPAFERLTGLKREDIIHKTVNQIMPDEDPRWVKIYGEVALTGKSVHFDNYSPVLKKHYEVFAYSLAPRQFGVLFMDVTASKQAEQALKESERREHRRAAELEALLNAVPAWVWIAHDPNCLHITGNRSADELLRLPSGGEASLTAPVSKRPSHFKAVKDGREMKTDELPVQQAAKGKLVRDFEYSLVFQDGMICHMLGNATPLYDEQGRARGAVAAFVDITERKRAETILRQQTLELQQLNQTLEQRVQERTEELAKSHQRLQQLASQLLQAQEKERKRVAVELHDSLLSELAAMKYLFEAKVMLLKSGQLTDPNEFNRITDIMQKVIKDARGIMNNLRPSILDEMGLIPTIGWLSQEFQKIYGHIQVHNQVEARENDIPETIKVVIFRVLQEALNNFAKHGKGDQVELFLFKSGGALHLKIQDNGQGFDMQKVKKGLGLESMRERVELLGGEFQVESISGQGTTIRATWSFS
jgi:PAS domain S-box-containing protein